MRTGREARHRGWVTAFVIAVALGCGLMACGTPSGAAPLLSGTPSSLYRVPSGLRPAPPGSIVRSSIVATGDQLPAGAKAYRVIYHSRSITGGDVAVSGLVVVPGGTPPALGFPIASWAHGTTGLADQCAPSIQGVSSIPLLGPLLRDRMIVVATDYQGLGTPGVHPYLVGQSEAQGVLDAAQAAHQLEGKMASNATVIYGYSQGGQAALFAGQIAQAYAPNLFVAGVAAIAPVASLDELAPVVPEDKTDDDASYAAMALVAWSAMYGDLPLQSEFTPEGLRSLATVDTECAAKATSPFDTLPTNLMFRSGWASGSAVRTYINDNEPGGAPTSAPILVVQGADDSLTPPSVTSKLVTDSLCRAQHDTVEYLVEPGAVHSDSVQISQTSILGWIAARLAGTPERNWCARLSASSRR